MSTATEVATTQAPAAPTLSAVEETARKNALALIEQVGRIPVVKDDETSGKVGDVIKFIIAAEKTLDDIRDAKVRPLNEEVKAVNASFKPLATQLAEAKKAAKAKNDAYLIEKERAIRAAAAEAARISQDKALAEAAALEAIGDKVSAEQALEAAVTAPAAVHVQTRGSYGSTSSLRSTWSAEVVDFAALPDTYKLADMSTLGALARGSRPTIPGVRWVEKRGS